VPLVINASRDDIEAVELRTKKDGEVIPGARESTSNPGLFAHRALAASAGVGRSRD
jgi:hypothetical protein